MPNIPTFQTNPGAVPRTAGSLPRANLQVPEIPTAGAALVAAANQQVGATAITARAGNQLASFGDEFANKYIEAKMQVTAADQGADLTRQLNEAQFSSSKIPDREKATADFDARSRAILDTYSASDTNPLIKAKVTAGFDRERVARLAATQTAAFELESQTQRGKLGNQLAEYTKMAVDAADPRLQDELIAKAKDSIDGRVAGGWLNPEAAQKMKENFESNIFRSKIELAMAQDPRLGVGLYDATKGKLNAHDAQAMGVMATTQRRAIEAQQFVAKNLPVLGQYGNVSHWGGAIEDASAQTGIRPSLIGGFISEESGGNANAVSPAGAEGPAQFMPGTARSEGVQNVRDPNEAIPKGAGYLKKQLVRFGGDEVAALAAYNWGPENVAKWKADGGDFSKLPKETQDYINRVMAKDKAWTLSQTTGDQLSGFNVTADKLAASVLADDSIPEHQKNEILAQINQRKAVTNGLVSSQRKQVADESETMGVRIANGEYKEGTFDRLADKWAATGDNGMAEAYRTLARNEPAVLEWIKAPPGTQDPRVTRFLGSIFPGKAAAIFKDVLAGQREDRKVTREIGADAYKQFSEGKAAGIEPAQLAEDATNAVQAYMRAGDPVKAQQIVDEFRAHAQAHAVLGRTPLEVERAEQQMREAIASPGGFTRQQALALQEIQKLKASSAELWKEDPMTAGRAYTGPLETYKPGMAGTDLALWTAKRAAQAAAVEAVSGKPVPLMTKTEINDTGSRLESAKVRQRQIELAVLSMGLPNDQVGKIADKIANGKPQGDIWAAAMFAYKKGDTQMGDSLIEGGNRWLEGGPDGKQILKLDPTTFTQIHNQLSEARAGLAVRDDGRTVRMQDNAIIARYVSLMGAQDSQGVVDSGKMNQAIRDVVGTPYSRNHTTFLLPKGVDGYMFDRAINDLTASDMPALKPGADGRPITLEKIQRYGGYRSHTDGTYEVWLDTPDGPRQVQKTDGSLWHLDIRPLVARSVGKAGAGPYLPPVNVQ